MQAKIFTCRAFAAAFSMLALHGGAPAAAAAPRPAGALVQPQGCDEGQGGGGQQQRGGRRGGGGLMGGLSTFAGQVGGDWVADRLTDRGVRVSGQARRGAQEFLTGAIACALTEREQNQAADAEMAALDSGAVGDASERQWRSSERRGVGGGVRVTERTDNCAIVRTMVTDENGDEIAVRRRRCMLAEGGWSDAQPV